MSSWKDHVQFILVEPAEPGNIGASARAMKNMGFRNLGIVRAPDITSGEARWFAHNAADVLDKADRYGSLREAVSDKSLVVGATRRTGKRRGVIMHPDQAAPVVCRTARRNRVAVVFGREDRGLLNEEIEECGFLITIPASASHPSLNLSHAVMVISYELSRAPYRAGRGEDAPQESLRHSEAAGHLILVDQGELSALFERISKVLVLLEYLPRGNEDLQAKITQNLRRFIGRAGLTRWELRMLHGLCSRIEKKWKE